MKDEKISLFGRQDMSVSQAAAATVTHGISVAGLAKEVVGSEHLDILDMAAEFQRAGAKVSAGDLSEVEYALVRQFMTLDVLFGRLGSRAMRAQDPRTKELYMKLALRAQSQARASAETIGALKNPPLVIARQANISAGPQQINNGVSTIKPARASRKKIAPNELLEETHHGDIVDTRTPGKAGTGHPKLATVDIEHRAKDGRRKKSLKVE